MFEVFIGFDGKEEAAFNVARASLMKHAKRPVRVRKLELGDLRVNGLYRRGATRDQEGHRIDTVDGLPFSTDFAFSRFLLPWLTLERWVVFCDSDFLYRADINDLFSYRQERYALMCVKHDYRPTESRKMSGQVQSPYPRKNWTSFMMWNMGHPATKRLTLEDVNTRSGRWLHTLGWLRDEEIGELPEEWNWLEGASSLGIIPKAVHYTRGVPTHEGMHDAPFADEWRGYLNGNGRLSDVGWPGQAPS